MVIIFRFERKETGSTPVGASILFGVYCQLGDGLIWSQEVAGASPVTPTILVNVRVGGCLQQREG